MESGDLSLWKKTFSRRTTHFGPKSFARFFSWCCALCTQYLSAQIATRVSTYAFSKLVRYGLNTMAYRKTKAALALLAFLKQSYVSKWRRRHAEPSMLQDEIQTWVEHRAKDYSARQRVALSNASQFSLVSRNLTPKQAQSLPLLNHFIHERI